jgi:hypothetical protein
MSIPAWPVPISHTDVWPTGFVRRAGSITSQTCILDAEYIGRSGLELWISMSVEG